MRLPGCRRFNEKKGLHDVPSHTRSGSLEKSTTSRHGSRGTRAAQAIRRRASSLRTSAPNGLSVPPRYTGLLGLGGRQRTRAPDVETEIASRREEETEVRSQGRAPERPGSAGVGSWGAAGPATPGLRRRSNEIRSGILVTPLVVKPGDGDCRKLGSGRYDVSPGKVKPGNRRVGSWGAAGTVGSRASFERAHRWERRPAPPDKARGSQSRKLGSGRRCVPGRLFREARRPSEGRATAQAPRFPSFFFADSRPRDRRDPEHRSHRETRERPPPPDGVDPHRHELDRREREQESHRRL
jgi:hypothetical protein